MPMPDYVLNDLSQEIPTPFQSRMLIHCKQLVNLSAEVMSKYYTDWDARDAIYRATKVEDKDDKRAKEVKAPEKMVVPFSYSQIQTFISFCTSLYGQRPSMFELDGNNVQGDKAAKCAEAILDRDLHENIFSQKMYQFLLDIGRFGIGIMKHTWVRESSKVLKEVEQPGLNFMGLNLTKSKKTIQEVDAVKFLGNRLMNISPYRFYPDVRLPISRFQEGAFCASEDEYSYSSLERMQADKLISGLEHVRAFTEFDFANRAANRFNNLRYANAAGIKVTNLKTTVILTEIQMDLTPCDFMVGNQPLGPEEYPIKYVVWMANDNRIVKCEPMGYLHNKFTYDVAQFSPDQHKILNESIAQMVEQLQDTVTWLINSHITSVRKTISNQFVVDPAGIEMRDFAERKPLIRLKPSVSRSGVDRWIKQLQVQDVTQNHISDANTLFSFMQIVTGINDNALGQFNGGRRSATEARVVNMSAASRLKLVAKLIYDTALEPMARKMISNHRDGLDAKTFVKIMGNIPDGLEAYNNFVSIDKTDLIGDFDFQVFDGTLPSEKASLAQTLQEILITIMQNPESAQILNLDYRKVFNEMIYLRGIKNIERFYPDQQAAQAPLTGDMIMQQLAAQQNKPQLPLNAVTNPNGTPIPAPGTESSPAAGSNFSKLIQSAQ
jgi:hypothetical protein